MDYLILALIISASVIAFLVLVILVSEESEADIDPFHFGIALAVSFIVFGTIGILIGLRSLI